MDIAKCVSHKWGIEINEEADKFKVPCSEGRSYRFCIRTKVKAVFRRARSL